MIECSMPLKSLNGSNLSVSKRMRLCTWSKMRWRSDTVGNSDSAVGSTAVGLASGSGLSALGVGLEMDKREDAREDKDLRPAAGRALGVGLEVNELEDAREDEHWWSAASDFGAVASSSLGVGLEGDELADACEGDDWRSAADIRIVARSALGVGLEVDEVEDAREDDDWRSAAVLVSTVDPRAKTTWGS